MSLSLNEPDATGPITRFARSVFYLVLFGWCAVLLCVLARQLSFIDPATESRVCFAISVCVGIPVAYFSWRAFHSGSRRSLMILFAVCLMVLGGASVAGDSHWVTDVSVFGRDFSAKPFISMIPMAVATGVMSYLWHDTLCEFDRLQMGWEVRVSERTSELEATNSQLKREIQERAELQHQRDRFFDQSIDMLCLMGLDGRFHRVNPAFERHLGYSSEEMLPKPFESYVHPKDQSRISQYFLRLRNGSDVEFQIRYRTKSDDWRVLSWTCAAPTPGSDIIYAVARDITNRAKANHQLKKANDALDLSVRQRTRELSKIIGRLKSEILERRRTEEILHSIAEGTSKVVGTQFLSSLVRQLATTYGVKCAAISEVLPSRDERLRTRAIWVENRLLQNYEYAYRGTPCGATLSNRTVFCPKGVRERYPDVSELKKLDAESYCGLPLLDSSGTVIGNIAIIDDKEMRLDIDKDPALRIFAARAAAELERFKSEEALRQSEQRLKMVISSAPVVLTSINKNHVIDLFDGSGLCSVGLQPGQFNGLNYFELWRDEAELTDAVRLALDGVSPEPVTHTVGQTRMETRCSSITDSSGEVAGAIAVCVDVTDRELAENVLRMISQGTSRHLGADFFGSLVEHVTKALQVDYCFISECIDHPTNKVRTLAFWKRDHLGQNFEFDLNGTRCPDAIDGQEILHVSGLQQAYPEDQDIASLGAESYLAIPLKDRQERVIGHLAILDKHRIRADLRKLPALQIFAARAAAELERKNTEAEMAQNFELLHAITEGISDAVFVKDLTGRYLTINSAGADIYKRIRDAFIGRRDDELFAAELAQQLKTSDQETIDAGQTVTFEEKITIEGETKTFLTTKGPYRNASGNIIGVFGVARDISEQKRMESALRKSEEFHRLLFDKHIDGVAVLSNRRVNYANPVMSEITGYSYDELIGMNPGDLINDQDRDRFEQRGSDLYGGANEYPSEYRIRRKNGDICLVEFRSRLIEVHGEPTLVSFVRDVTQEKKAQRALRLTQFAVDKASTAVFWVCRDQSVLYANETACTSLGYNVDELSSMQLEQFAPEFPRKDWQSTWEKVRQDKTMTIESVHQRKDQSTFPVEVIANFLEFENDEYLCAYARDISENKKAENVQRESHALLRTIIEGITDVVYLQDLDNRYLLINPAGAQAMELSEDQIVGKRDEDLIGSEDAAILVQENESVISTRRPLLGETCVTIGGEERIIQTSKAPHRNSEGKIIGVIGVCRDITEFKHSAEKTRQLLADLAHVGRLSTMGEMASGIAHEINQPLAAIGNYSDAANQLLESDAKPDTVKLRQLLSRIEDQSFRAGEIIRHMHGLVKRSEPVRAPVVIKDLVHEVVGLMSREIQLENIRLETRLPEKAFKVVADSIQIQQVIVNLIRNAIDALLDVPVDQRDLIVELVVRQDLAEIIVIDSGGGVEIEDGKDVFTAFYSTKPDGMGMGLGISRSIIEYHKGKMWHDTDDQGKTQFHFTLPLSNED